MNIVKKINLNEDESIVFILRRHAIYKFVSYIFALTILLAVAFFVFWLLAQGPLGNVLIGGGIFLAVIVSVRAWHKDNGNFTVITSARVVDISRKGFLKELVSSVKYDNIKDVHIKKSGLSANLFNHGTIVIETKSERTILELEKIHDPLQAQTLIEECSENFARNGKLKDQDAIYSAFIKSIPDLDEERLYEVKDFLEARLTELSTEKLEGKIENDNQE